MAAYGCVWPCAPDAPSPKHLTYGCAHTWDPALPDTPANSPPQWLQEHIPEKSSKPSKYLLSAPMAVYGCTHVSYGRVLDVTPA
eukprot:7548006-Pyramimonas_sp.AAC.1